MAPESPLGPGMPVRTPAAAEFGPDGRPGRAPVPVDAGPWRVTTSDQRYPAGVGPAGTMAEGTATFVRDNPPWAPGANAAAPPPVRDRLAQPAPAARAAQAAPAGAAAVPAGTAAVPAGAAGTRQAKSARRAGRRKLRGRLYVAVVVLVAVAAAGVAYKMLLPRSGGGPKHVITTPDRIGDYTQATALGSSLKIAQLRDSLVSQSHGEAKHVVDNVYQDGSQIVLFIGGNLTGSSSSSFISSLIGSSPNAVTTSAGSLGGQAACLPSVSGHPAECAWADNDTFGVVLSPTLSASKLATEMRSLRPAVEHLAK